MPIKNDSEVYVGITEWRSMGAFGKAGATLVPTSAFKNYFQTFDQLAYVQLRPEDGVVLDMASLMKPGQAIEFAVRKPKAGQEGVFAERRKAFFDKVAVQKGYVFDKELVAIDGSTQAVIIVWESMADFQNALGALSKMPEMGGFLSILDVQAYQATQLVP